MDVQKTIICTTATMEDIYTLPEGELAKLINGHLYMMAPP